MFPVLASLRLPVAFLFWIISLAESHLKKIKYKMMLLPARFQFEGGKQGIAGAESTFRFCRGPFFELSLVINFLSSNTTSLVIPPWAFGHALENWQMCSHGNRPVMPLSPLACKMKSSFAREEPAGDLTDLTSEQQWDFWHPCCHHTWSCCHC